MLIKFYLEGRQQRVILYDKHVGCNTPSSWGAVKYSVPQASILGPLLFFWLYINDLPKITNNISTNIKSKIILLADDTSTYIFSLAMFVINNPSYFQTNTALHGIDTRQKNKLHKPLCNSHLFKKVLFIQL
jgi:hypothetical protein